MLAVDERRKWRRRTLSTTILFRVADSPSGRPFRSGDIRDLSDGGVAFDTDDPPGEGALVEMFFKEHTDTADQLVRGRVVWTKPGDNGFYNVGVSFVT